MPKKKVKKKNQKQMSGTPVVSVAAKRYLKNNIVGNYGLYTFGKCPSCDQANAQLIADADNVPIVLFIENLYRVSSFDYITCENCGTKYLPKFIQIRNMDTQEVILNNPLKNLERKRKNPFTSDPSLSVMNHIIENNEFFTTYIEVCLKHFEGIVKELPNVELKGAIEVIRPDAILPGNLTMLRKYVLNHFVKEEEKRQFLQLVCKEFLIQFFKRNPVAGWVTKSTISEFGFHRLFIALAYAPLPRETEEFRYRAFTELQQNNPKLFDQLAEPFPYIPVICSLKSEQEYWSSQANKLERENEHLKAVVNESESKLSSAYDDIERLKQANTEKLDRSSEDIQKIKELKGFINELKEEMERLYALVGKEEELEETMEEVKSIEVDQAEFKQPGAFSLLQDKTVAIIGGVRTKEQKSTFEKITILAHDGRKLDPTFYKTIQQADIIILITTYCSHATMWLTKANAIANDKIILFEKSIHVPLLLQKANDAVEKKGRDHLTVK